LSRSLSPPSSASAKNPGNTVSKRWAGESVAVMTTRPGAASRARNGALAAAVLTNTTRPGTVPISAAHSAASRSGPARLNLASTPSKVPWPMSTTSTMSPGRVRPARSASAVRTLAAVACSAAGAGSGRRTRTWSRGIASAPVSAPTSVASHAA
jgi:hypothetical protein